MAFSFTNNKRISARYDSGTGNFIEQDLTISGLDGLVVSENEDAIIISGTQVLRSGDTMTGALILNADPAAPLGAATRQYVDNAVGSALTVQEDDVTKYLGSQLDFGHALDVTSGTGEALISVDESELTSVVFLTGDQTIGGNKTFSNNVILLGDLAVSGTVLTTEALLVEDNFVVLNSTVVGAPILDAGLLVNRGTDTDSILFWDETADKWVAGISGSEQVIAFQGDVDSAIGTVSGVLQSGIDNRVLKAGDTMTGNLTLAGADILTSVSGVNSVGSVTAPFLAGYFDSVYSELAPSVPTELANKAYVDAKVSSAAVNVYQSGVAAVDGASIIDFGDNLLVSSGTGHATISIDDAALLANVVLLTTDQSIAGTKTFVAPVILAAGIEPAVNATGTAGEVRWGDDYVYICVDTDKWKRAALASY